MLKDTEISEGELAFFAIKYPSAFRRICQMIREGQLTIIRQEHYGTRC